MGFLNRRPRLPGRAAALWALAGLFPLSAPASPPERLNVLLITIDTLRADRLGAYGWAEAQTPNIDRLAAGGVKFANAYSHVPLTLPSHVSLLTGLLPVSHGVRDNGFRLPGTASTLAGLLKKAGYRTAAFVGAFPLDSRFGLDRDFDVYDDLYGSRNEVRDLSFIERRAGDVNDKALAWLEGHQEGPFFVWVHYFDPHAPYDPPPPFRDRFRGREYDGEIAYTDAEVGRLIDALGRWGLADRTIVVLTADHGESLGEHQEATHGIFIYDATLHVPLIFRNKRLWLKPKAVAGPVGLVDVAPTILDLLGLPPGRGMQGESLRIRISGRNDGASPPCYIESVAAMMDRQWAPLQGLRTEAWKYIQAPQPELYDLRNDPRETTNLIDRNPDEARRLSEALEKLVRSASPSPEAATKSALDGETRAKLASLGYITGRAAPSDKPRPDPKTMIAVDNLFNEALISSESGRLDEAGRLYREVLRKQPDFILAYEYAAYNFYKMERMKEAVQLLEKALALNLETPSLVARLGLYKQEAGEVEESIGILEKAVALDPSQAEALNYLGVSYFRAGKTSAAEEAFRKAIALDADYANAFNNLGNCRLAVKDLDGAGEAYEKAVMLDPRQAAAYNGLGAVSYRKGAAEEAVGRWEKSLSLRPDQPDTCYNLGRAHLRLGLKKEALRFLELFLKAAPAEKYAADIEEVKGVVERLKKELGRTG